MIKHVSVYTYGDKSHANTINIAANFAKKYGAKLNGVFVKPSYGSYANYYGEYPLNLATNFHNDQKEFADAIEENFNDIAEKFGVQHEWHIVDEYENHLRPPFYSDYIFVSKPVDDDLIFSETDFVDNLILQTGLPTVVVPTDWQGDVLATKPVLGWKETKEAINAVRHTLELMRDADDVHILTVTKKTDLDQDLVESIQIGEYLSAHGIKCLSHHESKLAGENSTQTLIRHVKYHHRDAVIIGGYGRSRFRELILGGMTRRLIADSHVPVVLAH